MNKLGNILEIRFHNGLYHWIDYEFDSLSDESDIFATPEEATKDWLIFRESNQ